MASLLKSLWWLPCLLVLGPGSATPPITGADEPKTHVLYLGAEFSVTWRGKTGRVIDVEGESLVIDVDGVRTPLRAATAQLPIRMTPTMKLDRGLAQMSEVQADSAFSEGNNPHRSSEQGAALAQSADAQADHALANLRDAQGMAGAADSDRVADQTMKAMLASAEQAYKDSAHAQSSTNNSPGGQAAGSATGHDAFLVSFEVAAPQALNRPYAMVFVRYFEQPGNPRSVRVRIFPLTLARVDERPRRYHLLRAGLPPGYELDRYAVHLFDAGREIATTTAAKRVELTSEEAFQYTLATHAAGPDESSPPLPARDFWPADLTARLAEGNRNRLVHVRVDQAGRPTGVFHDAEGRLPVTDTDIVALLPELRFLPALAKGKPVSGVCRVNLGPQAL